MSYMQISEINAVRSKQVGDSAPHNVLPTLTEQSGWDPDPMKLNIHTHTHYRRTADSINISLCFFGMGERKRKHV